MACPSPRAFWGAIESANIVTDAPQIAGRFTRLASWAGPGVRPAWFGYRPF